VSVAFAVILTVGLLTIALFAVLILSLIRHVKLLATSLRQFQDEIQPVLLEIQGESERARTRAEIVPGRVSKLSPDARLRR
jgi:predicted PurR-regulated permease PerM